MIDLSGHRRLAIAGALIATLTLAGAAAAGSPPRSNHASPNAVSHAAGASGQTKDDTDTPDNSDHGSTVSAAAHSDLTGGPHNNHGGYVSCIARGGSNCTSTNPTIPNHPDSGDASDDAGESPNP